ncbi:Pleckstrin [Kalmanozyma brasiliensis GHG001]|uniref:PH domain-containing protein n=1 Tax=Kalmanozyma brasiliensis (strain GHG001) TaxID=1365824 RepID=V5EW60_KALBG|nr:Pleckstrin [Kalmanozyma brasiliensis GHG001]EST09780.1 Pleckstrin [Kalmanozyma brasiliensis GHG001]
MTPGSTATASSAIVNPLAARAAHPGTPSSQPSSKIFAPSRFQDDDLDGGDDGDNDEDDEDGELDGSEAHHNMINESTVKSGYLEKKGEKRKTWKKRWFVLRSSKLAYYKNEKEYQLLRFIDVSDIKTVASVELKKSVNTFGIVTPKRTFYVRAASRADMESWIEKLNEIMTQYAQSSTMTQEMAALELGNAESPAPSSTVPQSQYGTPSRQRTISQERMQSTSSSPIKIGIPGHGTFMAPAQPRPIPGSAAFSPLTATSDSETGTDRFGLSYTGSSISGSPSMRTDPSNSFLLAGQSPGGGGGHNSGSEMSDMSSHQPRPAGGFGNIPRQRSVSSSRRLALFASGATDVPPSPTVPQGSGGGNQILSSSDEEDDWDEEEVADQAMPLPALGTSQTSQQSQLQQSQQPGSKPAPLNISSLPATTGELQRDPNKVITQGYLMKQSGRRKVWRKRWFVLTPSRLLYSRSHMDAKAHRQIPISSILDALEYEPKKASSVIPTSPGIGSPTTNPFGFESSGDRDGNAAFSPSTGASAAAPEKPERRGSMINAAAGVASNMTAGMVGGSSKKRKENCFQIITPKRTFILCAPGEDEEIKWISALKTLITRQRNGQTPGVNPPLSPTTFSPSTSFPFFAATTGGNATATPGGSSVTSPSVASKLASPQSKASVTSPNVATPGPDQAEPKVAGGLASMGAAAQTLSSTSLASNQTVLSTATSSTQTAADQPETPTSRQTSLPPSEDAAPSTTTAT